MSDLREWMMAKCLWPGRHCWSEYKRCENTQIKSESGLTQGFNIYRLSVYIVLYHQNSFQIENSNLIGYMHGLCILLGYSTAR